LADRLSLEVIAATLTSLSPEDRMRLVALLLQTQPAVGVQ
jgi:hypothetical protein